MREARGGLQKGRTLVGSRMLLTAKFGPPLDGPVEPLTRMNGRAAALWCVCVCVCVCDI